MVRDGRLPDRRHQRLRRRPHPRRRHLAGLVRRAGAPPRTAQWAGAADLHHFGQMRWGAVYSPIQTDLVVAVRDQGYMFVTGPDVIKDVTGEDVSLDELGAPTTRRATATSIRWWSPRPPHTSTCGTFCRFCRPTASTNRRSSTPGWNPKSPATIWNSTRSCRTRTTWPTTCTRSCCGSSTTATSSTSLPRPGRRSSPATRGWTGGPLVWWPTSPCTCRGDRQRGVRQGRTVHPV